MHSSFWLLVKLLVSSVWSFPPFKYPSFHSSSINYVQILHCILDEKCINAAIISAPKDFKFNGRVKTCWLKTRLHFGRIPQQQQIQNYITTMKRRMKSDSRDGSRNHPYRWCWGRIYIHAGLWQVVNHHPSPKEKTWHICTSTYFKDNRNRKYIWQWSNWGQSVFEALGLADGNSLPLLSSGGSQSWESHLCVRWVTPHSAVANFCHDINWTCSVHHVLWMKAFI